MGHQKKILAVRFGPGSGDSESRDQDAKTGVKGLSRFIIFTGPWGQAQVRSLAVTVVLPVIPVSLATLAGSAKLQAHPGPSCAPRGSRDGAYGSKLASVTPMRLSVGRPFADLSLLFCCGRRLLARLCCCSSRSALRCSWTSAAAVQCASAAVLTLCAQTDVTGARADHARTRLSAHRSSAQQMKSEALQTATRCRADGFSS